MIINFYALKATDPGLYKIVADQAGLAFTGQYEFQPIQFAALAPTTRRRLSDWKAHQPVEPTPDTASETTVVDKPVPPPRDYGAEERAALMKDVQKGRAIQRLKEWQDAGLEDTENNANLIRDFVNNSAVKGYWSSEIVDASIANLGPKGTNQLTWRKALPPPAPEPPTELTEVLEPWQLPLDADKYAMKRASVKALHDLIARSRKMTGKYIRPRGTFGSSIF